MTLKYTVGKFPKTPLRDQRLIINKLQNSFKILAIDFPKTDFVNSKC